MAYNPEVIAERMRALREKCTPYSQAEMAARVGVSRALYSNWENGRNTKRIRVDDLARVVGLYGLTLHQFFAPRFSSEVLPHVKMLRHVA